MEIRCIFELITPLKVTREKDNVLNLFLIEKNSLKIIINLL